MDEERGEQSPIEGRNVINVDKNENNENDDDNDHDDTASLLVSKGHHQEYCNSDDTTATTTTTNTTTNNNNNNKGTNELDSIENENENSDYDETTGFISSSSTTSKNNDNNARNDDDFNNDNETMKFNSFRKGISKNSNKRDAGADADSQRQQIKKVVRRGGFFSFLNTDDDSINNNNNNNNNSNNNIFYKTLLPDIDGIYIRGHPVLGGGDNNAGCVTIKLIKFIVWTFLMIGVVHVIVKHLFDDRDKSLEMKHIWTYECDLIVRDMVVFFFVGRLYQKQGIDYLTFLITAILSNIYFESQNFVWFLQHSVSLYEIHCIWPWELWLFVIILIPTIGTILSLHVLKGYRERTLVSKLTEMGLCILFFVAPMITSKYFHLHHWYAGWLLGMHANYDTW